MYRLQNFKIEFAVSQWNCAGRSKLLIILCVVYCICRLSFMCGRVAPFNKLHYTLI